LPIIKVNDININYEIQGEGFPLIMIHGFVANIDWWDLDAIKELSKKFKVILFDNRGSGWTDKPESEYSIKMMAEDTVGLLDALQIPKAHVLGHSMGGSIAEAIAIYYPEKIEKMILSSTYCGASNMVMPSSEVSKAIFFNKPEELTPERIAKEIIPNILSQEFIQEHPDRVKYFIQQMLKDRPFIIPHHSYRRQREAAFKFDCCRKIKRIAISTLVIHCKDDILVPPENSDILVKRIPNAKKHLFDTGGHEPYWENPKEYAQSVIQFLES
jgi:3-oxoadipate enol-lactonase